MNTDIIFLTLRAIVCHTNSTVHERLVWPLCCEWDSDKRRPVQRKKKEREIKRKDEERNENLYGHVSKTNS
jgi:hypothetical protein